MKLHHLFIPSKKNKFHPAALRSTGLIFFSLIFAVIPVLYNAISAHQFQVLGYSISISVEELNSLSNQERSNVGLQPLSLNSQLNNAAYNKAVDMFADNYWAHVAPDGTTPWVFIANSGYQYVSAGENLAKGFNYSNGVVSGWMASQSHKDNIINPDYVDVGYAVVNGVLLGEETTLVVAMYGAKNIQQVATTESVEDETEEIATVTTVNQPSNNYQETIQNISQNDEVQVETVSEQEQIAEIENENDIEDIVTSNISNIESSQPIETGFIAGVRSLISRLSYNSLNWGQKTSLLLASVLILLFIMKHTLVWRAQKRGIKQVWLRAHPIGQVAILITAIIATLVNSVGVVL